MPAAPRSPLEGTDRLVVDGTNLLYRLGSAAARGGTSGTSAAPAPPAAIIGRLRAAIPAAIAIDLVFDGIGHGVKGRVAQGMFVRYSGRHSADEMILGLTAAVTEEAGGAPKATAGMLVITNDRELRGRLQVRGVRSMPLAWLMNRLDLPRLSSPAPGNRRPTIGGGQPAIGTGRPPNPSLPADEGDRPGWKPGRGATAKTGPAHKLARHKRHPQHGA